MHANKREEISEVWAGDIAAARGAARCDDGDTICATPSRQYCFGIDDLSRAGHRTSRSSPRPRPTREAGGEPGQATAGRGPSLFGAHRYRHRSDLISGMGELHLEIITDRLLREFHGRCQRWQTAGRLSGDHHQAAAKVEGRFIRQSWRTRSIWPCLARRLESVPLRRGADLMFDDKIKSEGRDSQGIHPGGPSKGFVEAMECGPMAGYPATGYQGGSSGRR